MNNAYYNNKTSGIDNREHPDYNSKQTAYKCFKCGGIIPDDRIVNFCSRDICPDCYKDGIISIVEHVLGVTK